MLPPVIDPNLAAARDAMLHGKIPDALQIYGNLIRKGKLLEDISFDLKEALYRFPVEVSIWQALGDAYMRANRLQDALDAYTKAEELLR
jgi:tetratricopeptide (TPR) repeat protein